MRCRLFGFLYKTQVSVCSRARRPTLVSCSTKPVRFPVKMTNPATAILYITEDLEYMTQLKDTLHVKEVEIGKVILTYLLVVQCRIPFRSAASCTRCPRAPPSWSQAGRFAVDLLAGAGLFNRCFSLVSAENRPQRNGLLQAHLIYPSEAAKLMNTGHSFLSSSPHSHFVISGVFFIGLLPRLTSFFVNASNDKG